MSKAKENTFEIIEREIQKLKEQETLSLPDMRRLEMLTNIRKVLITTGTDTAVVLEKHENITDEEILEELSKPYQQTKIPAKILKEALGKTKPEEVE